jgi:peptidoglycan/LPS O-acetylase OafA/YrhL
VETPAGAPASGRDGRVPRASVTRDKASSRVPELDLLRFIAASAVVFYHFTYRPLIHGVIDLAVFGPFQGASRFGYMGVNLFFMISGFVILWSSQGRRASEFVVSRIARLYPSFWVCMLLSALVLTLGGADHFSIRTIAANLTMVPNLLRQPYVDGVYWTLFVELKFYVLIFIVLASGTMKYVEALLGIWIAISVASASGIAPGWLRAAAMYPYGPYFISGCVVFLARSRGISAYRGALLLISCILATRYAIAQQTEFTQDVTVTSSWVAASVVVVFHMVFVAIAVRSRVLPENRWWYLLGSLTYPLYLLHNRVGKTLWAHLPEGLPPWAALATVIAVIYLLSSVVAAIVERRLCSAFHRAMSRQLARVPFLRSAAA